jgi:hypothetical protein
VSPSSFSRSEHLRAVWPWLPLWMLVALLAIFAHGPMPLYSTRTLAVAWDMFSHGHWLVPHINGQPYSEKAPLLFWLIEGGWFVFGVSDVWPRVLEVLFGGTQLVLVSLLARRLFPQRPWMTKAAPWMLLAFGYAFLFALQIMYDVLLAVWALAALLCLTPKPRRSEPRWLLFGACVGLGLLTKGPVMLLHIAFPWLLGPLWSEWARCCWRGRCRPARWVATPTASGCSSPRPRAAWWTSCPKARTCRTTPSRSGSTYCGCRCCCFRSAAGRGCGWPWPACVARWNRGCASRCAGCCPPSWCFR